ncbi:S60 ribosomal protein L24 [Heterostelium album PN500]|uniref:S60 ribosomal protein L24 n=1 Tax=Heterostelium pallidum (strain ATCC 26659 / Pp 5 / PN500) TaxID=670386 RepID=D3BK63_HETP5|nr:S60 ribosomal protein L24 [Heterostelium album PN500]EFA78293.1 S60 ribosomal protein L24 [Heterostelium album PN500]|eukprot:XP_020430418.1 S60 ribosomal protein L24 [Heterostelium album PN500]
MKTGICNFSEFKIYPAKGIKFVRGDSKTFHFINGKVESLFFRKINPRDIPWTSVYRRINKNVSVETGAKKRTKKTQKFERSIVGASLEVIKQKREQKPEFRAAQREAALRDIKEKKKAAASTKAAAPKAAAAKKDAPKTTKTAAKSNLLATFFYY